MDTIEEAIKNPKGIGKLLKKTISFEKNVEEDIDLLVKILFGSMNPNEEMAKVKAIQVPIGVCGKIINNYDLLWFCKTCGQTPNSGLCNECYTNSSHEGHESFFRKGYIGCCDCGDPDAWKPSGNCTKHKGYDESKLSADLLPLHVKTAISPVIKFLMKAMNHSALEYKVHPEMGMLHIMIIRLIIGLCDKLTDTSAIFAKIVCEGLNSYCFHSLPEGHKCNFRTYLTEEEKTSFTKNRELKVIKGKAKESNSFYQVCECKVLENLIKTIHILDQETLTIFCEYLVKMTKSPLLKDVLGYGLLSNYETVVGEASFDRIKEEEALEKVGLQLFTVDELSIKYVQKEACQKAILNVYKDLVKHNDDPSMTYEQDLYIKLFLLKRDLRYFNQPKTMKYLVEQSTMMQEILKINTEGEFLPLYIPRTTHVLLEKEAGSRLTPFSDKFRSTIIKSFLVNTNYTDYTMCKAVAKFFKDLIREEGKKEAELKKANPEGMYFATQVYRSFYYFLAYFLHSQLALMEASHKSLANASPIDLRAEMRNQCKLILTSDNSDDELDTFIEEVLRVSLTPIFLLMENRIKKWIYYGPYLDYYSDHYYKKSKTAFYYPDYALAQLLIGLYDGKGKKDLFELFLATSMKPSILTHLTSLALPIRADVEASKKKMIVSYLEEVLHFYCTLCSNDSIGLHPLVRLYFDVTVKNAYREKIKETAFKAFKHYAKKNIIQFAMISPNGQFAHNNLIEFLPKKLKKEKGIDIILKECCNYSKNPKGQVLFSVKPDNLQFFDPYWYGFMNDVSNSLDKITEAYKKLEDKTSFDGIFGGSAKCEEPKPKEVLGFCDLVTDKMIKSSLLPFCLEIILCSDETDASETLKLSAYKLLKTFTIFCNSKGNREQKKVLVEAIAKKGKGLFADIEKRMGVNEMTKISFRNLASLLCVLNSDFQSYSLGVVPKEEAKDSKTAKEKQTKIMEEFKKKQAKFLYSNYSEIEGFKSVAGSDITCAVCKEVLSKAAFDEKPYGITVSGLNSALVFLANKYCHPEARSIPIDEAKKKLGLEFTNANGEGVKITTCNHYAHFECWKIYKSKKISVASHLFGGSTGELLQFCPLCHSSCIGILPAELLVKENEIVKELSSAYVDTLISTIPKNPKINTPELYYKQLLNIIQYNVYHSSVETSSPFINTINAIKPFLIAGKICGRNRKYEGAFEEGVVETLKYPPEETLACSRIKALINTLFIDFIKHPATLLTTEEASAIISKQYELYLVTFLLKIALDKNTIPVSLLTQEALFEIGSDEKQSVMQHQMKFVTMAINLFCLFCPVDETLITSVKNILKTDDPISQWKAVVASPLPIKFAEVFENSISGKGIFSKPYLEKAIKQLETEKRSFTCLDLLTTPLNFKLYKLDQSYKKTILQHYVKPCSECGAHTKEKGLCMYCGIVICLPFLEEEKSTLSCHAFPKHNSQCQGSGGLYLRLSNGAIVIYFNSMYETLDSPYLTKFGESMTVTREQDEDFELSETAIKELENMVTQDKIAHVVLTKAEEKMKAYGLIL